MVLFSSSFFFLFKKKKKKKKFKKKKGKIATHTHDNRAHNTPRTTKLSIDFDARAASFVRLLLLLGASSRELVHFSKEEEEKKKKKKKTLCWILVGIFKNPDDR